MLKCYVNVLFNNVTMKQSNNETMKQWNNETI